MDGNRAEPLTLLQFPFSAGIDESTRDELVEPGAGWAALENGRQDHRGGYSTRHGFTALGLGRLDATSRSAGARLFAHRDQACVIDGGRIDSYAATPSVNIDRGRVPEPAVTTRTTAAFQAAGAFSHIFDCARCNGYVAYLYSSGTSVYVGVEDDATGTTVRTPEVVATSGTVTWVGGLGWYSTYIIVFVVDSTSANIVAYYLNTASTATLNTGWVSIGNVATDKTPTTAGSVALSVQSLTNRIAFGYVNNSVGASRATVKTMTIAGVTETATVNTNTVTPLYIAVEGSIADTLWVAWNEDTLIRLKGLDADVLATTLASTATVITCSTIPDESRGIVIVSSSTAGAGTVLANDGDAIKVRRRNFTTAGAAVTTSGADTPVPYTFVCSRAINVGGRYYALFYGGDFGNAQQTVVLCDYTDLVTYVRPVALADPALTVSTNAAFPGSAHIESAGGSTYVVPVSVVRSGTARAVVLIRYDFANVYRWQPVRHGDATFLSGGLLAYFDGVRVAESGFLLRPPIPTGTVAGTGITGTFRYAAVYEEVDANGNWCISGVSDPSAIVTAVDDTVTVTLTPLGISARLTATADRHVRIALYRTATGGSAPYYRLGTCDNNTSTSAITYDDATADATLITAAKLYRQPGGVGTAQDRRVPPGLSCLVSYNGMLVGAQGSSVWYSGQDVYGEGTWFNPVFQGPIPGNGDVTALWVLDGTLVAAKRRELYAITGEAPSDSGASGGLGAPRRLAVDVGSIGPVSCATALGTFFQSERGIEVLDRSGAVFWIGENIQDTVAAYPICTAITLDPASNTVLVELASAVTSGLVSGNGRTAVYDLALKAWVSTDRRKSSAGVADTPAQSGCVVYMSGTYRYAWLGANGVLYHEDASDYLDADGSFIAKRAISANVKAGGPQGHQHINKTLLLARWHTSHDLNMSFAYDYSSTYKTARLYTAAQVAALVALVPNEQLEHGMHDDAQCEAVRVQLQDVTPSSGTLGTGQGATWISIAFELVPQQGAYALPDESR